MARKMSLKDDVERIIKRIGAISSLTELEEIKNEFKDFLQGLSKKDIEDNKELIFKLRLKTQ
jgi:hypothetical protein